MEICSKWHPAVMVDGPKPVFALSKWNDSQTKCFHSPFIRGGFNLILNYVPNHTHCVQKRNIDT